VTDPSPSVYDDEAEAPRRGLDRRAVLTGACLACVGVGGAAVFAACGSGSSGGSGSGGGPAVSSAAPATFQTSQVPVGGGTVFADQKIVVTQPSAGEFKAFSAICTHQGFLVGNVQGGTINCFHHGSKYDMTTGKNVAGPAPSPLPSKTISASGGTLTVT
jgi:Rieske Fe-S protein